MAATPHGNYRKQHLWQITPVRDLILISAFVLLCWFFFALSDIFVPVLLAFILADILNPVVTLCEKKWNSPRPLTVAVIVVLGLAALAGTLAWLVPLLLNQFTGLTDRLPAYLQTLDQKYGIDLGSVNLDAWLRNLQTEPRKILGQIFSTTGQAVGIVTAVLSTAGYAVMTSMLFVLSFFLFAWHFNTGIEHVKQFLPERSKHRIIATVSRMDSAVADFFRGRLVIAFIVAMLLSAGWFLTDVPYWFFLGVLTGFLNIVPYLSLLGWPLAVLFKYLDSLTPNAGQSVGFLAIVVWPSVVYVAVELLDNWLLTPWIQSGQTKLSAATILIVVFIGGALAGVWGLILAIPTAACIKIFLTEFVVPPLRRWAATH